MLTQKSDMIPDVTTIIKKFSASTTPEQHIINKIEAAQYLTDFPVCVHLSEHDVEWPNDDQQYELGVKFGFKGWRLEFTPKEKGAVWVHIDSD